MNNRNSNLHLFATAGSILLFALLVYPIILATLAVLGSRVELAINPDAIGDYRLPNLWVRWLAVSLRAPDVWLSVVLMSIGSILFSRKQVAFGFIVCTIPHPFIGLLYAIQSDGAWAIFWIRAISSIIISIIIFSICQRLELKHEKRV